MHLRCVRAGVSDRSPAPRPASKAGSNSEMRFGLAKISIERDEPANGKTFDGVANKLGQHFLAGKVTKQ